MFRRYLQHLFNYGVIRVINSGDFVLSLSIVALLLAVSTASCDTATEFLKCTRFINSNFISAATVALAPITSVIITGLAILVSFTSREFLSELEDLGVFDNLVFVFEHTVFLSILTLSVGLISTSYQSTEELFYIFLFLFNYTLFSIVYLIELLAEISINKSRWAYKYEK